MIDSTKEDGKALTYPDEPILNSKSVSHSVEYANDLMGKLKDKSKALIGVPAILEHHKKATKSKKKATVSEIQP